MSRGSAVLLLLPEFLAALRGWQLVPFAHQALALCRRHLLEALEALVQLLASGR